MVNLKDKYKILWNFLNLYYVVVAVEKFAK